MISSALEAKVVLSADGELAGLLEKYAAWLPALFIVSQVELTLDRAPQSFRSEVLAGLEVTILRAEGRKCERCWNYSKRVGENPEYPTVCERCLPVLEEIQRAAS